MLSRQESSLSSSRRQAAATPPPPETHQAKAIGCMSGIIHLFSKYQNRNKRLTFGRKQEKCKTSTVQVPPTRDSLPSPKQDKIENQISSRGTHVPRSPTIPPEIRRSNAVNTSESPRTPSSLVARLMGLDDVIVKRPLLEEAAEPIKEKRQRLLQALNKCNDDLEELKRIIQTVRSPDQESGNSDTCSMKKGTDVSPNSVLDPFTRSPPSSSPNPTRFNKVRNTSTSGSPCIQLQHRKPVPLKKPGEDDEPIAKHLLFNKYSTTADYASLIQMKRCAVEAGSSRSSRAMVKSVEEVCNDIVWGEKREIRRIGLVLQDHLCKDLVQELVQELMKSCCVINYSLPLQGCKRTLSF